MFNKKLNEEDEIDNVILVSGNYCDNFDDEIYGDNNNNNVNSDSDSDNDVGDDAICLNLIFNEIECSIGNRLFRMLIEDKDKVIGKNFIGRGFIEIKK
jgi:hypothetical protein